MKNTLFALLAASLVLYCFTKTSEETISLTLEVNQLRNNSGIVQFALSNKEGSIPDEHYKKYYKLLKGEITNKGSKVTFSNIPQGKCAVNIFHGENMNGKIDKGFILPIEGIVFSNFESIGFSNRPNFSKASFELKRNTEIKVKVIYL
jgi:uncharacterized protein (DUF2141 family)